MLFAFWRYMLIVVHNTHILFIQNKNDTIFYRFELNSFIAERIV